MGAAFFYHLTQSSAAQTLFMLLPKCAAAGWSVELRGTNPAMMEDLDRALWLGPEEQFLPHGLAGQGHDADQPVLLTTAPGSPARDCVISVGGADLTADETQAAQRVCVLFDGHDDRAVDHARTQWRSLTTGGIEAQYWAQEGGGWTRKA